MYLILQVFEREGFDKYILGQMEICRSVQSSLIENQILKLTSVESSFFPFMASENFPIDGITNMSPTINKQKRAALGSGLERSN